MIKDSNFFLQLKWGRKSNNTLTLQEWIDGWMVG